MKTPTVYFANTFLKELICVDGVLKTSKPLPMLSTLAREKLSDGGLLPRRSMSTYY